MGVSRTRLYISANTQTHPLHVPHQGFPNCGTSTPWWYARRCQGVREQDHASLLCSG
ncbi:hypothetical protein J6590_093245 [Homalodisca vitripennis]|nr:hypothetical protein J6590_093245 [Homalodisca vitripennis]